jgi:hypothetical protein
VIGVSNAVSKLKNNAVPARMRQHGISLCCLEDAGIAHEMLAAATANDYGDDLTVESAAQTKTDELTRLQALPKGYARAET